MELDQLQELHEWAKQKIDDIENDFNIGDVDFLTKALELLAFYAEIKAEERRGR